MSRLFGARLAQASPREIIEAAALAMPGRLAVVSSFGTESAVLLKFVADVDPSLPVLFLDTLVAVQGNTGLSRRAGRPTRAYRRAYHHALAERAGVARSQARIGVPRPRRLLRHPQSDPLAKELAAFDGWISGRKRFHGGDRAALPVVEADGPRLKFNPLARLTPPNSTPRSPRPSCRAIRCKP